MDNHLLSHAIAIATEAHKGQKDKYGQEYLHHPIRVMNMGRNLKEKIVGILHDVVEDTEWTFEDLERKDSLPKSLKPCGVSQRPPMRKIMKNTSKDAPPIP